jgi:tetratricopeptide (TPR) repeat protein
MTSLPRSFGQRVLLALVALLTASAIYLYAFPQQNVFYAVIVLLHLAIGVVATIVLLPMLRRLVREGTWLSSSGWALFLVGAGIGFWLVHTGTIRSEWKWMYAHMVVCAAALAFLVTEAWARRAGENAFSGSALLRLVAGLLVIAGLGAGMRYLREARWANHARIENPGMSPVDMAEEGDGPQGPFFPSSAQVYGHKKIPSKFFMESDSCKRCHEDIYNQWFSSAHHFSSFNNQWYRKSIEYMQDTIGTKPSKWCGGCHDPAVLYAGLMDTPIKQIVHTPPAQAGLGCMMCHSIAAVKSTMGQGDFYLEYPELHELAASKNPVIRYMHDFLVKLNPEPHRRAFLKPFMKAQTAEFCSSCHKVHLDVPVNHYRWIRGFNEYDNWQASGVSGQGARSFYYPKKPQQCADCHMPLEHSADMGNVDGKVHSHRFPAANTALPVANEDVAQLKITEDFLKSGILSVDIFALSPAQAVSKPGSSNENEMATTFAVGEEAEVKVAPGGAGREAAPVTAPLNRLQPAVRRGDTVRVDVVVRTKKIGHFFPGGTVDAYDTWLELKGTDDKGQTIFWSGMAEDGGKGPVEKGAHFYRSLQIDEHGNPINKRNAWATRAVVYVRLIPPGAADTVHYRVRIPENAGNKITLHARLCYRKFAWWSTQFSFAGQPDAAHPERVTPSYDDRTVTFDASLTGVSAKQQAIPDVPIIALAEDEVSLPVVAKGSAVAAPKVELKAEDWQRWNDYGIGLLLQGDLKSAQAAFFKVTEIDAKNPDGWVNLGRTAVQEGDMDAARPVLEKALAISPDLARAHYFYARVLRADGKYEDAAQHLRKVLVQYPRDRVALNDLGRILFLERKYDEAVKTLESVLAIDPEDLQAHYNLMLCYNGLGNEKMAKEHQERYLRFKADEASQTITGKYRQLHPEDNNERQSIHEHVSIALNRVDKRAAGSGKAYASNELTAGAKARSGAKASGTTEVVPFPKRSPGKTQGRGSEKAVATSSGGSR